MNPIDHTAALTLAAMRHAHSRPSDQAKQSKLADLLAGLPPEQLLQVAQGAIWNLGNHLWAADTNALLTIPMPTTNQPEGH